jgi:hypothetical protein
MNGINARLVVFAKENCAPVRPSNRMSKARPSTPFTQTGWADCIINNPGAFDPYSYAIADARLPPDFPPLKCTPLRSGERGTAVSSFSSQAFRLRRSGATYRDRLETFEAHRNRFLHYAGQAHPLAIESLPVSRKGGG